jgi:hypothetical protein
MQYTGILTAGVCAAVACATESTTTATQLTCATASYLCVSSAAPAGPSYTISGVVYDNTPDGRHPAPGLMLDVRSARDTVVAADSVGRYSAPVWGDVVTIEPAAASAFLAPCPVGTDGVGQNPSRSFDVDVVAKTVLSTTGVPDSYPIQPSVSGIIFEQTAAGPLPVAGAWVTLGAPSYYGAPPESATLSDSLGRYLLCTVPRGTGTDQPGQVNATKDGFAPDSQIVVLGWGYTVNVELRRNP